MTDLQVCQSVTESYCLNGNCQLPYGQCTPWQQLDTVEAQEQCRQHWTVADDDSNRCARFYLTFDPQRLPQVGAFCLD